MNKKQKTVAGLLVCLILSAPLAFAGDADALIQLDKEWGSAAGSDATAPLLADGIIAMDGTGVANKAQMMEAAASADAPTGPYVAGDYQVNFLSDDIAVMVHSSSSPDAHWSMHVWQKNDGKWQVAATASAPAED